MITPPPRGWLADEVQAPALVDLLAWYNATRGDKPVLPVAALPALAKLPGGDDLALIEIEPYGGYRYRSMGEAYKTLASLVPDGDDVTRESRAVIRQHLDLASREGHPFHISITRWDGPNILQYDRLILPLDDGHGAITHLLVGEAFLRYARGGPEEEQE